MPNPPSEHPLYGDVISVARAINEKLSSASNKICGEDYVGWMEPTDDNDGSKFDSAVRLLIPQIAYEQADSLARLDDLVMYVIGLGDRIVGGVDMQAILDYVPDDTTYEDSGEFTNDLETIYVLLNSHKFMDWMQESDRNFGSPNSKLSFEDQLEIIRDSFNEMYETLHSCGE